MLKTVAAAVSLIFMMAQAAAVARAAEVWPTRPIRMVVPFSPGGSTDQTARVIAEGLRPLLGQTALVDNRPGAGGNIAAELVANAAPDGYTYLVSGATMATNMSLYRKLRYDFMRDFSHVSQTFSSSNVLVVSPSLPVNTLAEFIALVKKGQQPVTYGSGGHGTSQHLAAALFNHMVGGNMTHVPFKGGAPAAVALLGGEIHLIFAPLIEVLPHIRAGSIKALAVCGKRRSPMLPNAPVVSDLLPGYETASWGGISAPANTPPAIVNKLNAALVKVLTQPAVKTHLAEADKEPVGSSPEDFRKFILTEIERLRLQVKISGAKAD